MGKNKNKVYSKLKAFTVSTDGYEPFTIKGFTRSKARWKCVRLYTDAGIGTVRDALSKIRLTRKPEEDEEVA